MNRYLLRLFTVIVSLFCVSPVQAQDPMAGFGVEANIMAGRVIKHTAKFTAPIPPLSTAFDINFLWHTYGKKDWQQRRNFPTVGIGIMGTDYGNKAVFGHCIGIYPNIQITLLRHSNFEWTLRLGDGLGYVTRKYQTTSPVDTLNTAIGSNLNDFAVFMTDLRFHVNDHWQMQFGANLSHISNGDYHRPNLGVNMGGLHFGVQYSPVTNRPKRIIRDLPKLSNRWLVEVRAGIGYTESRSPGNPELPTYVGALFATRRWNSKNKLIIGADIAYHKDVSAFLKWCNLYKRFEDRHSWDGAIFGGNEFLLGRVGIVTQLGIYYHQTYLKFDPFYEKVGVNYYLLQKEHGAVKELFVSALLLAHEFSAQYAEFGIGAGF